MRCDLLALARRSVRRMESLDVSDGVHVVTGVVTSGSQSPAAAVAHSRRGHCGGSGTRRELPLQDRTRLQTADAADEPLPRERVIQRAGVVHPDEAEVEHLVKQLRRLK